MYVYQRLAIWTENNQGALNLVKPVEVEMASYAAQIDQPGE